MATRRKDRNEPSIVDSFVSLDNLILDNDPDASDRDSAENVSVSESEEDSGDLWSADEEVWSSPVIKLPLNLNLSVCLLIFGGCFLGRV